MSARPTYSIDSAHQSKRRPRVGVFGATLGTGNLGVDALGISMVQGVADAIPNAEFLYQAWDVSTPIEIPYRGAKLSCEPLAVRRKGSLLRRDGLQQLRRMSRFRKWLADRSLPPLPTTSQAWRQLLSCDAILDVSAGDSFANIYGDNVFHYQTQIKQLCLDLGIPLVLMPQTYGPYYDESSSHTAAKILSRASLVCSREGRGLDEVSALCGKDAPNRLIRVPDMAFILEPEETKLPAGMQRAIEAGKTRIAINVSGLLYFDRRPFGLKAEHKAFVQQLLKWALQLPNTYVLFVPHVVNTKVGQCTAADTSDTAACRELVRGLDRALLPRVDVLPPPKSPAEAKYAMKQCDFFIGARMHAFIGASSQHVPGALLAYSKKAEGLASLLGISDAVVDLRTQGIDACIADVDNLFRTRAKIGARLASRVPEAKAEIRKFFHTEIAPIVLGTSDYPSGAPSGAAISRELPTTKERVLT